jgi:phospholipase/lecithinase/hemolysin
MRKLAFVVFSLVFIFVRLPSTCALDLSKFKHLIVFGDSLSDNGNLFAITKGGNPPAPPIGAYGVTFDGTNRFFPGRFTDGQNWVDYFFSVAPSVAHFSPVTAYFNDGGTNFAVGGSTSEDLTEQINTYLSSPNGHTPANDLSVIWIGANDFAAGSLNPSATVENIRAGIALRELLTAAAIEK